jgi:hypothetical protein
MAYDATGFAGRRCRSVEERQGLLKKALTGNAVFSVVSGVAILFANRWLVEFLGLPDKASLAILGVCLIRVTAYHPDRIHDDRNPGVGNFYFRTAGIKP